MADEQSDGRRVMRMVGWVPVAVVGALVIWWLAAAGAGSGDGAPSIAEGERGEAQMAAQRVLAADGLVLQGVPRIGYDVRICTFPGTVEALMAYLKEPVDYDWVMGVTGAPFRRTFHKNDGGNVAPLYFSPEPERRIFAALGYEFRSVGWADKAEMIREIKASIDVGRPVIACGIVGPPEPGIVSGYAKGGEVLIGQSYFQDRAKFPMYYEQTGWYEANVPRPESPDLELGPGANHVGLIVLGERKDKTPQRQLLIDSLRWAIDLERTARRPYLPDHVCGLAAYDAWADALETDADYPADDAKTMERRAMVHMDQYAMVADRASAVAFLRQMMDVAPEIEDELNAAAEAFEDVGKVQGLWPFASYEFSDTGVQRGLADPQIRRELAQKARQCRDAETRAVTHLEAALAKLAPVPDSAELKTPTPQEMRRGANWQVENVPLPSVMRAAMNVCGRDLGRKVQDGWSVDPAYETTLAAGGEAFDFLLAIHENGAVDQHFRRFTPEAKREQVLRSLRALGYDGDVIARGEEGFAYDALRKRVTDAIAQGGRPVVLVSTETFDTALVTGYRNGGAELTGWTCTGGGPAILFEGERKTELPKWFEKLELVLLLKQPAVINADRCTRDMLKQGAEILRREKVQDILAGPALFEAWAQIFEETEGSDAAVVEKLNRLIDPAIWDLAERRHYGRVMLNRLAEQTPTAAAELQDAAAEFGAIHDLMWRINSVGGATDPGSRLPKLGDRDVRRQIAEIIREAADHDARAAELLDAALAKL